MQKFSRHSLCNVLMKYLIISFQIVGHCHPAVTQAGTEQMKTLSTNSRFLHSHILDVAERLKNTFPDQLKVCFFVNSG